MGEALGFIETVGMAAAIEAADASLKSANVKLIGYELTKGKGMVTVKIKGNVSAVKAAIAAAVASASKVNEVYATLVIPNPAPGTGIIVNSDLTVGAEQKGQSGDDKADKAPEKQSIDGCSEEQIVEDTLDDQPVEAGSEEQSNGDNSDEQTDNDVPEEQPAEKGSEKQLNEDNSEEQTAADNPLEQTNVDSKDQSAGEKQEDQSEVDASEEQEKKPENNKAEGQDNDVCNLCGDKNCPRRKGQPRTLCIHYNKGNQKKLQQTNF